MTDYCLFTVTHIAARKIYIRGIADITEPIDEYDKIIEYYDGNELKKTLPSNPYSIGSEEHKLFEELLLSIESNFEEFGDELVFAKTVDEQEFEWENHAIIDEMVIEMEKVIVDK